MQQSARDPYTFCLYIIHVLLIPNLPRSPSHSVPLSNPFTREKLNISYNTRIVSRGTPGLPWECETMGNL